MTPQEFRIYLSPPHAGPDDFRLLGAAFESGWIAPVGPEIGAFERSFADYIGAAHAVALSSGTAALHLALIAAGVQRDDEVLASSFTFAASVNPIVYLGARPVLIDSEPDSWNMDPGALEDALRASERRQRVPRAILLVHLYGQPAHLQAIRGLADRYGIILIEDAAESLGATHHGERVGRASKAAAFSFNGNKLITTSGGGMLTTHDATWAARVRKLATQAREPAAHYEHTEIGYNYRLSNLLAALGRAQLQTVEERIAARRRNFEHYSRELSRIPGVEFMPEARWGRHTRWLTCLTIDPAASGGTRDDVLRALANAGIEARPLWKPMHLQPIFQHSPYYGSRLSDRLFERGICLPSGSNLQSAERAEVIDIVRSCLPAAQPAAVASQHDL